MTFQLEFWPISWPFCSRAEQGSNVARTHPQSIVHPCNIEYRFYYPGLSWKWMSVCRDPSLNEKSFLIESKSRSTKLLNFRPEIYIKRLCINLCLNFKWNLDKNNYRIIQINVKWFRPQVLAWSIEAHEQYWTNLTVSLR